MDNVTKENSDLVNSGDQNQNNGSMLTIPLQTKKLYKKSDFNFLSVSGQGSYAKVYKVKDLTEDNGPIKAIKVMEINVMKCQHKLYQVYLENNILQILSHPNIVSIDGVFEEQKKIFIVLEYLSMGDFSDLLILNYPLKEETIKFYSGEIVNFLGYLKENKVVHRDLKPENIMLDNNYHLKVIDFATARIMGKFFSEKTMTFQDEINEDNTSENKSSNNEVSDKSFEGSDEEEEDDLPKVKEKKYRDDFDDEEIIFNRQKRGITFVGTAEYVSPEVLKDIKTDYGADIWALGCMIYLMYYGVTPFKEKNEYLIFQKIKENKLSFPEEIKIPEEAKDLIIKLLNPDPKKRIGNGENGSETDFEHLRGHPFFKGINFDALPNMKVPFSETFKSKAQKLKEIMEHKKESKAVPSNEINKKIEIIKKGILKKKSPLLHYNTREIIVDSTPKLDYIDPDTKKIKGSVYLDQSCSAEPYDDVIFFLNTPKRQFKFKSAEKEAFVWVKVINDAIKKYS